MCEQSHYDKSVVLIFVQMSVKERGKGKETQEHDDESMVLMLKRMCMKERGGNKKETQ